MNLYIQLLGGFHIRRATGESVALHRPRQQILLSYVLLQGEAGVLRSHLAFQMWPDSTEKQAFTNLRKLLFTLRAAIPDLDRHLQVTPTSVAWVFGSNCTLDVAEFETGMAYANQVTEEHAQRDALSAALDLYRGALLPGHYDDWVLVAREQLHLRYVNGLSRLAKLYETAGELDAALDVAVRLRQADPLHEATYRLLMGLYLEAGEPAKALRVYHDCVAILAEELGVEPGEDTQALYARILRAEKHAAATVPARQNEPRTPVPLAGRRAEWQQLRRIWQEAQRSGPRLVIIQGEPGIGKTRLAQELVETARHQGFATAYTRAYAAEGRSAYSPIADLLHSAPARQALHDLEPFCKEELVRILPDLLPQQSRPPAPMTESWQQRRFHEALARACLALGQPLLIHLDDLQWFDAESLAWLHFFLRYETGARVLVVGTLRATEVDFGHPYREFRNTYLQHDELHELSLNPLNLDEVTQLAAGLLQSLQKEAAASLYRVTEGNPLFVLEALRAVKKEGAQAAASHIEAQAGATAVDWPYLTPKVQAVIQARLVQLSPLARQMIRTAAVIGRHFSHELLQAVRQSLDPDRDGDGELAVVAALDELWQRQIIREHGPHAYDFGHDRIRDAVYSEISPIMRAHLHGRVAATLDEFHGPEPGGSSSEIAAHYEAAGKAQAASHHYQQAAQYARERFASQEALRMLSRALALIPERDRRGHYELRLQCERIYNQVGLPAERLENLQVLDRLARELQAQAEAAGASAEELKVAQARRAMVAISYGSCYSTAGQIDDAFAAARTAIRLAEAVDAQPELAQAYTCLGFSCYWMLGDMTNAHRELTRAVELAHRLGMEELEAICLEQLAATGMFSGLSAQTMREYMTRAYAIHEKNGNLYIQGSILNKFGYITLAQGEDNPDREDEGYAEAIEHYSRGVEIARQIGAYGLESSICNNLAFVAMVQGDYRGAEHWLQEFYVPDRFAEHRLHQALNLSFRAELRLAQGRLDDAVQLGHTALERFQGARSEHRSTETYSLLGYVYYARQEYEAALAHLQQAVEMARVHGDRRFEATALVRLGHVYLAQNYLPQARTSYAQAYELRKGLEQYRRSLEALVGLAQVTCQEARPDEARRIIDRVWSQLKRRTMDYTAEGSQVYTNGYAVLQAMNDPRTAEMYRLAQAHLNVRCQALEDEAARRVFRNLPMHRPFFPSA